MNGKKTLPTTKIGKEILANKRECEVIEMGGKTKKKKRGKKEMEW